MKPITVVVLFLLLFCNTVMAEDWNVTWIPVKESIIDKEYIITVQNMQVSKRDVDISSFFAETNFDISNIVDIKFYEWKDIPYTYTVDHYDEVEYSEYQQENGTWYYWTESIYSYTETVESVKLDWKVCKSQLFKETGTTKEDNYGFINIPAYGSKPKSDGTYNGTKIFKLIFRTPIVYDGVYGSVGKVALLLDDVEHHPYWDTSWLYREEVILTGGMSGAQTDYQILLNVTYETGMQEDFDDLRFTNDTHEIDSWLESKVDSVYALVWVEFPTTPADSIDQTYYMYYGNTGAASDWDIFDTFVVGDDFTTKSPEPWTEVDPNSLIVIDRATDERIEINGLSRNEDAYIYQTKTTDSVVIYSKINVTSADPGQILGFIGVSDTLDDMTGWQNGVGIMTYYSPLVLYVRGYSGGSGIQNSIAILIDTDYWLKLVVDGTTGTMYVYSDSARNNLVGSTSVTIGDVSYSYIYGVFSYNTGTASYASGTEDDIYVCKYTANPPTYAFGTKDYYAGSIHYNATSPYNHTIESDETIYSNRTIILEDDINWTASALTDDCNLVVTEYNLSNITISNFTIYNATLDWLQVTNLTPTNLYRLQYANCTEINLTGADANGIINYTENLIPEDYQLIVGDISVNISLYSSDPCCIYTNYTGSISIKYIVESNYPLNLSSLAALFGVNYTLGGGDMHSYLKVPSNSIASEGIYRAHNRNITPYMAWESNDTITDGNVWQWSGGDINDFWIQNNTINSTHTWINVSGIVSNVFPSMFYLNRDSMYSAPKTAYEINSHQGIILKMFDLEGLRGRNNDYYVSMYFDTLLESTTPTENIEMWYCNHTFDPTSDDPTTCPCCVKMDEWDSTRWMNHEAWQPHNNVSYAKPLIAYAGQHPEIPPDEVVYIYLASNTQTSKSYMLNTTNYDPGICNITYAQTETMWLYNELSDVSTPLAYTPSFYATFVRDYEEFVYQIFVANDHDCWGWSGIDNTTIGLSNVPPTHCVYNYYWWDNTTDYNMTGIYKNNFWINLTYGYDPDNGGELTHVLSLYDSDYNFVAFINDSLSGNATDIDIYFDISDYNIGCYKFKIDSTDNENTTSTSWSKVFELKPGHPFLEGAYHFYDEMGDGLTDFRDGMGKYLVWGIVFFAVGLSFALFTKIKETLIGGK